MKELLEKPGFMTSAGTLGADVSYLLAVVFTVLFLIAWGMAKKAQGTKHHKLILISMVSMVVYFCGYYYARQLGVLAFEGKEGFGGPQSVYENVFVPVLTTHLVLVTLGLVLAFYMLSLGFRASEKVDGEYMLKSGDLKVSAKKFKKVMLTIVGLAMLSLVYNMVIRHASMGASIAWALIFATIALVVSLEKGIEKMIPDGARRHRIIGRGTMIVYALTLVTSTTVFFMLYVFYPAK
jgi:uncharacterized membrane protein YozB (DUF420 family)